MLTVKQAQEKILSDPALSLFKKREAEVVSLLQANNRILLKDQIAQVDVPPWDNSAMDGYAVNTMDLKNTNQLSVSQVVPAGVCSEPLERGTAARIFTGAPLPKGADAVEMQENTRAEQKNITFLQPIKAGANIRRRGEDISIGSVVVESGTKLTSQHIGLLASVGMSHVPVAPLLRVAVLSTGNELVEPGHVLEEGKIYNSNRYLLFSLLQQLGCDVIDGGMIADDLEQTKKQLAQLSEQVDVVISTGGVSVGDEDHVKNAVEAIGQLDLWKIAVKPGKPLAFGHIIWCANKNIPFFGLPGNPVSAFVTFLLFVKPYLLSAQGIKNIQPQLIEAVADFNWPPIREGSKRVPLKREEYLRARLKENGCTVEIYPNQSSGALSSVAWANCLAIAKVGSVIDRGDKVQLILF